MNQTKKNIGKVFAATLIVGMAAFNMAGAKTISSVFAVKQARANGFCTCNSFGQFANCLENSYGPVCPNSVYGDQDCSRFSLLCETV